MFNELFAFFLSNSLNCLLLFSSCGIFSILIFLTRTTIIIIIIIIIIINIDSGGQWRIGIYV